MKRRHVSDPNLDVVTVSDSEDDQVRNAIKMSTIVQCWRMSLIVLQDSLSLAKLVEMFPNKSVTFLQQKLSGSGKKLQQLIEELLLSGEGEETLDEEQRRLLGESLQSTPDNLSTADLSLDMDTTVETTEPRPGSSRETTEPRPRPGSSREAPPQSSHDELMARLLEVFPQVSPAFLQEKASQLGGDMGAFDIFVSENWERRSSLPSKKDWEEGEERKRKEKLTRKMKAADFLAEEEDPVSHYSSTARPASSEYKEHTRHYVINHFARLVPGGTDTVSEQLTINNNLLVPTVKALEHHINKKGKYKKVASRSSFHQSAKPKIMDLEFLKEYVFMKLEPRVITMMKRREKKRQEAVKKARAEGGLFECPVCYEDDCLLSEVAQCEAGCLFCPDCVRRGSKVQIGENKSTISCLLSCGADVPSRVLEKLLPKLLFNKLMERQQMEEIKAAGLENLVQCPACSFAIVITDPAVRILTCGNSDCGRETCRLCGEKSHIPLACHEVEKDEEVAARTKVENAMSEAMIRECVNPQCKKKFFKTEGCNRMRCECGQYMCYLCRQPVEDNYKHFYGEGASPGPGLCPLWSNINQVHGNEVKEAAARVKTHVGKKLKYDPTQGQNEDDPEDSYDSVSDYYDEFEEFEVSDEEPFIIN